MGIQYLLVGLVIGFGIGLIAGIVLPGIISVGTVNRRLREEKKQPDL